MVEDGARSGWCRGNRLNAAAPHRGRGEVPGRRRMRRPGARVTITGSSERRIVAPGVASAAVEPTNRLRNQPIKRALLAARRTVTPVAGGEIDVLMP